MKNLISALLFIASLTIISSCSQQNKSSKELEKTSIVSVNSPVLIQTSDDATLELKNGNKRFIENKLLNTNYKKTD